MLMKFLPLLNPWRQQQPPKKPSLKKGVKVGLSKFIRTKYGSCTGEVLYTLPSNIVVILLENNKLISIDESKIESIEFPTKAETLAYELRWKEYNLFFAKKDLTLAEESYNKTLKEVNSLKKLLGKSKN